MTKKYEVIIGCQVEGTPVEPGEVIELYDRIANKLLHTARPRIKECDAPEKPKREKKTRDVDPVDSPAVMTRAQSL